MLNWPKLVATGRAKEIGVPWNEAELKARFELGIPADFVRAGVLTAEAYADVLAKGLSPKEVPATWTLAEEAVEPSEEVAPKKSKRKKDE